MDAYSSTRRHCTLIHIYRGSLRNWSTAIRLKETWISHLSRIHNSNWLVLETVSPAGAWTWKTSTCKRTCCKTDSFFQLDGLLITEQQMDKLIKLQLLCCCAVSNIHDFSQNTLLNYPVLLLSYPCFHSLPHSLCCQSSVVGFKYYDLFFWHLCFKISSLSCLR